VGTHDESFGGLAESAGGGTMSADAVAAIAERAAAMTTGAMSQDSKQKRKMFQRSSVTSRSGSIERSSFCSRYSTASDSFRSVLDGDDDNIVGRDRGNSTSLGGSLSAFAAIVGDEVAAAAATAAETTAGDDDVIQGMSISRRGSLTFGGLGGSGAADNGIATSRRSSFFGGSGGGDSAPPFGAPEPRERSGGSIGSLVMSGGPEPRDRGGRGSSIGGSLSALTALLDEPSEVMQNELDAALAAATGEITVSKVVSCFPPHAPERSSSHSSAPSLAANHDPHRPVGGAHDTRSQTPPASFALFPP
jgi:hypothetical protein